MNAPTPLEARLLPWAGTMRVASWAFATVVGLALFYFGLVMGSVVPWLALPLTISGIAAALYCAWRLQRAWHDRRADSPVVTVDETGYRDARLGVTIPWSEIARVERHQPGTQVRLRIEARQPERFLKPRRRLPFGRKRRPKPLPPGATLESNLAGLTVAGDAIVLAAEAFLAASS